MQPVGEMRRHEVKFCVERRAFCPIGIGDLAVGLLPAVD
jgi:hypothetical protein